VERQAAPRLAPDLLSYLNTGKPSLADLNIGLLGKHEPKTYLRVG